MEINQSTDFGRRVAQRLRDERVIWLTTVRRDGTPQPTPVWFYWDGETFLIYSQSQSQKIRNIAHDQNVALNFNSTEHGSDIVVFWGEAAIDPDAPPANEMEAYLEKYRADISRLGYTPEHFAGEYSIAIRVTPTNLRGH